MEHVKTFILRVMKFYDDIAEAIIFGVGNLTENIMYYAKFLLRGMAAVIICLLLFVTMPIWYLPYKYFTKGK